MTRCYIGSELELFAAATNWKAYFSNALAPFMTLLTPISAVNPVQAAQFRMHRDAASISKTSIDFPEAISWHEAH